MTAASYAEQILLALDRRLDAEVELILYGRAALHLGFPNPPEEFGLSRDVDAVFWRGQAEQLSARTNFWAAVEEVNREFAEEDLYISHFFEETQVVLTAEWREQRMAIPGPWTRLKVFRLGNEDLFLTKLMRDDPLDHRDAEFIVERAGFSPEDLRAIIPRAVVPGIPEIAEQFEKASHRFL